MRKLKIYLDTTVINFLFADDALDYKEVTVHFFDNYLNDYHVFISEIVYLEINKTIHEEKKIQLLNAIKKYGLKILSPLTSEVERLAQMYVDGGIIPANKFEDAMHIAYATYYDFDILLSWNFKHLANIRKQVQINAVNKQEGYLKELNLFNPMEVIYEK